MIHDRDPVAQPFRFVHVVGGQQNGAAGELERFDQIPQLAPRLRIETRGGLVEKQEVRIAHQSARQRQALLLPARERAHTGVLLFSQLHPRDHFTRLRALLKEAAKQANGFRDRELLRELRFLQLNSKPLAELVRIGIPAHAEHGDLAAIGGRQTLANFDGRGLARSVRSQQAETLARVYVQIDAVHGDDVFIRLPQIA